MLFVFANRKRMIELVGCGLDKVAELGVHQGAFAEFCHAALAPRYYALVDLWDYDKYEFVLEDAPQMLELRAVFQNYFGNDPRAGVEAAFQKVQERFGGKPGFEVIKEDIARAADRFQDGYFDLIYLDGNHTYEYVLRDLYKWFPKLADGGLFVCNDFDESSDAAKQNLGVIPAFLTFSKRFRTFPIALTSLPYADFYFSNRATSPLIQRFLRNVLNSRHNLVELPNHLLAGYGHRAVEDAGARKQLAVFD